MTPIEYQRVNFASGADVGTSDAAAARVACVRGRGRGSHVGVGAETATLWISLRGTLSVETRDGPFTVDGRQFLFLPAGHAARGVARDAADWAMVTLPPALLRTAARRDRLHLFPATLPMTRQLLHRVVLLLRALDDTTSPADARVIDSLLRDVADAQAPTVDAWLQRACGRSASHRRQVLLRLLSPRNRILNAACDPQDLANLAAAARYSRSHFLRLFRDVFGRTPHDLQIDARMDIAKTLIAAGDLAISEVAATVGYESRYAFSRLFKKRVGATATAFREEALQPLRDAA